jgi:hypothetical protein
MDRESSPLSPMKKRPLGESTETDLSSRKEPSGFGGFSLKGTVDINTNNFGAQVTVTGSSTTSIKKKVESAIPANPILPKMVYNEMKQPP